MMPSPNLSGLQPDRPLRQIVLDTETTGHNADAGDRIVEIGCREVVTPPAIGPSFHRYLNPDRDSHPEALEVHGLTTAFLSDKPRFAEVVDDFLDFVRGAELIIHNAAFDVGFLDAELARCGPAYGKLSDHVAGVLDTLKLARELYPGQRVSLNVLCRRFGIDLSERQLHGALVDADLLLAVYRAMISGQLDLGLASPAPTGASRQKRSDGPLVIRELRVVRATAEERAAHATRMDVIAAASGKRLWS